MLLFFSVEPGVAPVGVSGLFGFGDLPPLVNDLFFTGVVADRGVELLVDFFGEL